MFKPRDYKDTHIVIDYLEKGSPFNGVSQVSNITYGLIAYESTTADSDRDLKS